MENATIKDVVLDKKLEGYNFHSDDFLASSELTVTITLSEYRRLVQDCATASERIKKADADKYDRDLENSNLKKANDELKAELYELQKRIEGNETVAETAEE